MIRISQEEKNHSSITNAVLIFDAHSKIQEMKKILLFAALFATYFSNAQVVINEVDCDQAGTDFAEFIELIGEPNTPLDGLVLVLFNGSNDQSYAAYDLSGFATDANGLFVLGNVGVNGAQIILPENGIQNGQDAVAVFTGTAAEWPNGTLVNNVNLIDAVVYDTADADDPVLLSTLTPGQPQVDENGNMNGVNESISRVPDGGDPFNTTLFVLQAPTPGAFNASATPDCDAGMVASSAGASPFSVCSDAGIEPISFSMTGGIPGASTWFVVTNTSGDIIAYNEFGIIDVLALGLGNYQVYAFTFNGNADLNTLTAGLPIAGVASDDCFDVSTSAFQIQVIDCSVPVCGGGTLTADMTTFCSNAEGAIVSVTVVDNEPTANYALVLTDENNIIVNVLEGNTYNTDALEEGTYRIWGVSYQGDLDMSTAEVGDDATQVSSTGSCVEFSSNFVEVNIVSCEFENGCQTLIISQYYEGTAFNKAIELYNTSNFPVDLDEYEVFLYANGGVDFTNAFAPLGILNGGETFLIVHPQAEAALLALADTTSNVVNFNGDDAIVLTENLITIDVFGQVGEDPGTFWTIAGGNTQDNSLIRYNYVTAPNAEWSITQNQYFSQGVLGDYSTLGNHDFIPCSNVPQMGFTVSADSVTEDVGTVSLVVQAYNVPAAVDVVVTLNDNTAIAGEDFVNEGPYTLSFPAGNSSQTIVVSIIDDEIEEEAEFFTAVLSSAVEVDFIIAERTIVIEANDQAYPYYTIAEIRGEDLNGVMDSIGVFCELRGIVHGINFNGDGTHFHIIDGTGGIKVFNAINSLGYLVTEGDSVHVRGSIEQFMGQAEIRADEIELIDAGFDLQIPTVVTSLSEENESSFVTMNCVSLVNPGQWIPSGTGILLDITDGTNTGKLWIDSDSELFFLGGLDGTFTVTGIVEQMDDTAPFDNNYVILPRYIADITNQVVAEFSIPNPIIYGEQGVTVNIDNTSVGATGLEWDFGDGNTFEGEITNHAYAFEDLAPLADITVTLIATNGVCSNTSSVTVDLVFTNVEELEAAAFVFYPNPADAFVRVESQESMNTIEVLDMTGRLVLSQRNINATSVELNTQALSAGLYSIRVLSGSRLSTSSIIIK